jgi:hypothetical protein
MLRYFLLLLLAAILVRAVWRILDGVLEGMRPAAGRTAGGPPASGVAMERDPVCGTFVIPSRALALGDGKQRVYFCSAACRDVYRARIA